MNDAPAEDESFIYDAVAYPTAVVGDMTPNRIAAGGLFRGWRAPDPQTASVLEVGCGDGLNLIAMAATHPGLRCVGFDLSSSAIERGRALVNAMQLDNIRLEVGDIVTWPRTGAGFDYIGSHGVYAWVPQAVQTSMLELIAARLNPGGIGYLSYDCLPATAPKAAINRFLRRAVAGIEGVQAKVARAHELLQLLASTQGTRSRLSATLSVVLEKWSEYNPAYIFHDWLAENYEPVSARGFEAAAQRAGLQVFADAGLEDSYIADLDESGRMLLTQQTSASGRFEALDMLRGDKTFRRTLVVRRDAPPPPSKGDFGMLRFGFRGTRELVEGKGIRYTDLGGTALLAGNTFEQAIMEAIVARAPDEMTFDEIAQATRLPPAELAIRFRALVKVGLVGCNATPQPFVAVPGERPVVAPFARLMARHGDFVITQRHQSYAGLGIPVREVMVLFDGTRTREDIANHLSEASNSKVSLKEIEDAVGELARQALFVA